MAKIKSKKRFFIFLLIVILIIGLICGMLFINWLNKGGSPLNPGSTDTILVTVPPGTSTSGIGVLLESEGVISDARVFRLKSRLDGHDGKFRAGEYSLSPGMSMDEIIEQLLAGRDSTTRFTIPEGYDIRRTADVLEAQGFIDRETFYKEIEEGEFDYWFVRDLPKGENRLEGYLYPETYEIFVNASEHDIINRMLSQFNRVFTEEHRNRMEELGLSLAEVMNMASIIEREAVVSEDRPIISGVFYNRLKIGMPLQSCATVQYILGEQKPVLSIADTQIESPYNTYIYKGLPPTPICSPGIESINAALWPEETNYIYFLAKGDGSHVFSVTYEEHLRNKARYID